MALIGFKSMTIRILDNQTAALDTNTFEIKGVSGKGATQTAEIKGLSADSQKVYGSNIAYYSSNKGVGDVSVEFEVLDLPYAVRQKILGYKVLDGLTFIGADTQAPKVSILLESEDLAGNPTYIGFFNGTFSADEMSAKTLEDKAAEPEADKLTYSALAGSTGNASDQYVGTYIGKDKVALNKLRTLLNMPVVS